MKFNLDKIRVTLLGISLFTSFSYNAQTQTIDLSNTRDGESVEYCTSHKKMNALLSNPQFASQFAIDQARMAQTEQNMLSQASPKAIYKIPIVFHILHNNGIENISDAQVMDALAILNRDYRLQNADALTVHNDFKASNPAATCTPADIEIEFVLATKAPNGSCFNGITRTVSAMTSNGSDGDNQVDAIVAGNNVYNGEWPGNQYMNIFICGNIGGAAGYTYNPGSWSANSMYNGIWILHNYTGSTGTGSITASRALTHEVGHWLNLSHTWGGNNDPGVACGSDGVNDTPQTRGVTSCNLNENFCGPRANVENYMDYSYCSKMFSGGQKARMRAALLVSGTGRSNLWTDANLSATGADGNAKLCQAAFTTTRQAVCSGESVQFNDASYNAATGWTWSFPGAVPATSTQQNPSVVYTTPGTYAVTLTATDGTSTDVETKTSYITVFPAGAVIPYFENFESYNQTSDITDFSISSSTNNAQWALATNAGSSGTKSIKLDNFSQSGTNSDEFTSKPFNLSATTAPQGVTLSFRYAYRKKTTANNESLKVLLTADCGDTWQQRKSISGITLSPLTATTAWTPTVASDWTTVHVTNVTSQYWVNNFAFKLRFDGNGGNNIYLDDINLYPGSPSESLGIEEKGNNVIGLSVFPNPAESELNVSFNVNASKSMNMVVTDLLGKVIETQNIQAATGSNLVLISTEKLAGGMYLLQIGSEGSKQTVQFLVK